MHQSLVIFTSFIPAIPNLRVDSKEAFGWKTLRIVYKNAYHAFNYNTSKLEAL